MKLLRTQPTGHKKGWIDMRLIDADALIERLKISSPDPEGVDDWIAIIDELPSVNLQPCEDVISRQAALGCCRNEWEEEVEIRLKSLPPVNPQESMREFTEEAKAYSKALDKIYKPTGFNVFDEPCDDAISRAQALSDYADWFGYGYRDNTFYKHLKDMPSIQPKPKTGHWIPIQEIIGVDKEGNEISATVGYKCSKCLIVHPHTSIFCPSCGAKMIEPQERSDKE